MFVRFFFYYWGMKTFYWKRQKDMASYITEQANNWANKANFDYAISENKNPKMYNKTMLRTKQATSISA